MNDISQLFVNLGKGIKYIFLDIPKKVFKGSVKVDLSKADTKNIKNNSKNEENNDNDEVQLNLSLRAKLNNWYDNLPSVKKKREDYEKSLSIFKLNPDGSDGIKTEDKKLYEYIIKDENGKIRTDYFAAFSKLDVYSYLSDKKYTIYKIETNKTIEFLHGSSFGLTAKMKTKDLVFWLTQLSTYIKAGIPLTDAVKVLAKQDKKRKYKSLYESIIYELTMGQTFSEALNRQGKAFPGLLINMVKAAEMTGSIEDTLEEMANYYSEVEDTKRAVKSALAYPCILAVFAIGVVIFMLSFIIPKFVDVYNSMDAEIPAITKFTLKLSDFLKNDYAYLIIGVGSIVVTFILLYKNVKAFRTFVQSIIMHIPVIGPLLIAKEISLFARTFASLQKNNILLTDSIEVLSKITSNEIYKDLEIRTIKHLIKGNKMSEMFNNHWAIPDIAYFMIVTGESTGELAEMLDKVADFYSKEEKNTVASIKTFIEPAMIVVLAGIIGFILMAILVPMFGMYDTIS